MAYRRKSLTNGHLISTHQLLVLSAHGPTYQAVLLSWLESLSVTFLFFLFFFFFLKDFIYLFMRDTEREAEIQAEGEAGSMQGT